MTLNDDQLIDARAARVVRAEHGWEPSVVGFDGEFRFDVESVVLDGHAIVKLRGDLDVSTADRLQAVTRRLHSNGTPNLVIDLSELGFVDSSGVRAFVVAQGRQREIGGDLELRSPSANVRRTLEIVGLDQIMTIT